MAGTWLLHRAVRPCLVVVCSLPALHLLFKALFDQLGPNPAEALIRGTGDWTLRGLCVVLAVTPVRIVFQLPALARLRRTLGLTVFAYAMLHLLCYAWLDMGLEWADLVQDIAKRPFILVGFVSWLVLLVLAATSFNAAVRWLGGRRWQWLHRAVYLVAPLAILHFYWMRAGKQNFNDVVMYALVLAVLLGWRMRRAWRHSHNQRGV
jgi:sulfoxide reductase heme-binding subunit YedZ